MIIKDVLEIAYTEMPDKFSSMQFKDKVIELGLPKDNLKTNTLATFLKNVAKHPSKFMWEKPKKRESTVVFNSKVADLEVKKSILFLQENGYRVQKVIYEDV